MEALRDFSEKVAWRISLTDLKPFCGVHFSNELLDAMPVHIICRGDPEGRASARLGHAEACPSASGEWQERYVEESGDGFGFVTAPIGNAELRRHLQAIPQPLAGPYETEVNLAALNWIESLAPRLIRGYVLAVDYGYSREDYYSAERNEGTLQCYARHRLVHAPLSDLGEMDMTAHVDWTSLAMRAEEHGLRVAGFTDQHHFATGIAAALMPEQFDATADPGTRRALQTLLHPELLGKTFQFLALTRNVPPDSQLSGFKFGRDPRAMLGL
jgi:SAM-dependent MidA family methyltransferase